MQKTKGSIIRSRARWYELGEKCNKYLLNLEKRSYEKKHITKLKTPDGSTVEDPKTILTAMKNFYNQLYTSQSQLSAQRFSTFFDCESLPKLDSTKVCEGLITAEECLAALKTFQPNKTPGTDGLTAEFYLRLWGPFLETPGNLTGLKSYFEIKFSRKVGCVLTSNEVHFVSLADNFTVQF